MKQVEGLKEQGPEGGDKSLTEQSASRKWDFSFHGNDDKLCLSKRFN